MATVEAHQSAAGRRDSAHAILLQRLAERVVRGRLSVLQALRFIPSIDADKAAIAEFSRSLNLAQDSLAEALKAVEGLDRPHLEILAAAFTDAQRMATEATEQRVRGEKNLESLETLRREIDQEQKRLDALERETEPLRELAGLFSGGNATSYFGAFQSNA